MIKTKLVVLLFTILFTISCTETIIIKRDYNFNRIKRIAVFEFKDYDKHPNSGSIVSDLFAKYLIKSEFDVVERIELEKIINEHKLNISGVINSEQMKQLGILSGADAIITGNITLFSPGKKDVVIVKVKETTTETRYSKNKNGNTNEKTKLEQKQKDEEKVEIQKVVEREIPHTYVIESEIGITCKMIDVETGEIIWVASDTYEGINTQVAAEYLVSSIIGELTKYLSKKDKLTRK